MSAPFEGLELPLRRVEGVPKMRSGGNRASLANVNSKE